MMILEESCRQQNLQYVARLMLMAARTAPKGRGADNLFLAVIEDRNILNQIADKMAEIGEREGVAAFVRDSAHLREVDVVVILATKLAPLGLKKCGLCGWANCAERAERAPRTPCVFNAGDLGIAIGSAVSVAADHRVDNRIMYTIGVAVNELGWPGQESGHYPIAYGIPLSSTAKNPFFDR